MKYNVNINSARCIGKMLTDKDPKVVNGPEILSKYVGQSEENIRALFGEARIEQDEKGDESSLHIVIFDEIDAICKSRGSVNSGTGVHDTVVNQLLSMIDGVDSLHNVLIIGMTNRKDLLDDALLRPGRLEVHVEISLPDEQGREQIFRIHTRSLRDNGFLDENVSLVDLAKRTKNYSGAEIEGVVRSAVSYAMNQRIEIDQLQKINSSTFKDVKVGIECFNMALKEVQPEYGAKEDNLKMNYSGGFYIFNDKIQQILDLVNNLINNLHKSNKINSQSLLLRGNYGTGKTALASYLASKTLFPFIRIISPEKFIGYSDQSFCTSIAKVCIFIFYIKN